MDGLLEILEISQAEFCIFLGLSPSTPSRWKGVGGRKPTEATFTVVQMKRLKQLLESKGLAIEDLPDSFAPYKNSAQA